VFESFYTAQRGDGGGEGTGLGLAIARGFIGAHGGSIVALDGPGGVGSTFRISLPLPEDAPDPQDGGD
jgi:two-component system sensor histidine kinase KdpD